MPGAFWCGGATGSGGNEAAIKSKAFSAPADEVVFAELAGGATDCCWRYTLAPLLLAATPLPVPVPTECGTFPVAGLVTI